MKYWLIKPLGIFILIVILIPGCRKKNHPPYTPYTPSGPMTGVTNTTYYFSALVIDTDGDSVSMRFDWGDGYTSKWSEWVESEQVVRMSHFWLDSGTYYIRVQAKDRKENISEWSLPHYLELGVLGPNQPGKWLGRRGHTSVVFNNKIWVLGGFNGRTLLNDVWYSPDGFNWFLATPSAAWPPRENHISVVFDNKIWVIGGIDGSYTSPRRNDVWYSTDGFSWVSATDSAQFLPRCDHAAVVFDNKIWVIGGLTSEGCLNDVWHSLDGVSWICDTDSAKWAGRFSHAAVNFNNKIWVLGGMFFYQYRCSNDVWFTVNGRDWSCASDSTEWLRKYGHQSIVFDGKIWVFGGFTEHFMGAGPDNDVWNSADGTEWSCLTETAEWRYRDFFSSVVFDNKIWLMGGRTAYYSQYNLLNDVWYSSNGANWFCAVSPDL